jgi:phosphoribosylformylglycinamidine (FGAM) synthase-like enzyme
LKYEGLQPWEIFLSEAQERMSLAVQPEKLEALRRWPSAAMWSAPRSGTSPTTEAQRAIPGQIGGLARPRLHARRLPEAAPGGALDAAAVAAPKPLRAGSRTRTLLKLLGALNVCSKEAKSRIYDGEVKGLSVVKPFVGVHSDVPTDATVMRYEYGRPKAWCWPRASIRFIPTSTPTT